MKISGAQQTIFMSSILVEMPETIRPTKPSGVTKLLPRSLFEYMIPSLSNRVGHSLSVPLFNSVFLMHKLTRSLLILCCSCSLLTGCVTGEKIQNISVGMTAGEVRQILGSPNGVRQIEGHEVYVYSNRLISGWSYDRADFNVIFDNGRVTEYGPGEVRPGPHPQTVILVPLRGF